MNSALAMALNYQPFSLKSRRHSGRREAASPESMIIGQGYGNRARACRRVLE
jgi:hypothetical protein